MKEIFSYLTILSIYIKFPRSFKTLACWRRISSVRPYRWSFWQRARLCTFPAGPTWGIFWARFSSRPGVSRRWRGFWSRPHRWFDIYKWKGKVRKKSCIVHLVGIKWLRLTYFTKGLMLVLFKIFFWFILLVTFRGYLSIPATKAKPNFFSYFLPVLA